MFKIKALEFSMLQSLVQNQNSSNLGPNMPYLGIFGLKFENSIAIIKNGSLEFDQGC